MAKSALRIIVADDNADQVLTLAALLEDAGHVVRTFKTGAGLVEAIEQFQAEVCILDIEMPRMNGLDACKEIRSRYTWFRYAIIALTGNALSSDVEKCKSAGMNGYLSKPVRAAELYEMIDKL